MRRESPSRRDNEVQATCVGAARRTGTITLRADGMKVEGTYRCDRVHSKERITQSDPGVNPAKLAHCVVGISSDSPRVGADLPTTRISLVGIAALHAYVVLERPMIVTLPRSWYVP